MNRLKLLLSLSVALNVGFVTLLILHTASSSGPMETGRLTGQEAPAFPEVSPSAAADEAAAIAPATIRGYGRLLSALRATGLPEAEAQRILRGAVLADWHDDVRRMQRERPGADEFWKAQTGFDGDVATHRGLVEMRRAREAALIELTGDGNLMDPWIFFLNHGWSGLPADKQRAVMMLEEDYGLLMAESKKESDVHLEEDLEALQLLHQARLDDLAAILSPGELEEYELRHSDTAHSLRQDLKFFDPTEEEFREIFQLRRAFDAAFPAWPANRLQQEQRQATQREMDEALQDLLGEQRLADYRRGQDHEFQQLAEIALRLDLPMERANEIYDFKKMAEEQHLAIHAENDLTPEDRREALRLIVDEARQMVREALGERGYQFYTESGGWWIHRLERSSNEDPE